MLDVLTAADVQRHDAAAALPVARLMDNAGYAVARAARAMLHGCYGRRVLIVCGKGNNGGDGLVAGRVLHAMGAHVTAIVLAEAGALSPLARANLERFPGRLLAPGFLAREMARADLIVDAIFGVGLARAPEGPALHAIRAIRRAVDAGRALPVGAEMPDGIVATRARVLSVDVPSGMDADTGRTFDDCIIPADVTVTFGGPKPGLLFRPALAGDVSIADIGTPHRDPAIHTHVMERVDVAACIPRRARDAHKRRSGTVLVAAGSRAMPGAASLAGGASVHAGAGLTILCAPEEVCRVALGRTPEMTTIPAAGGGDGVIDPKTLDLIRPRLAELDAIVLGPGLSLHAAAVEFARALLDEATTIPVVIDADGISALVGAPHMLENRHAPTILTPHAGELARLMGTDPRTLDADRIGAARIAARTLGVTIVFKGPGTIITDGDEVFINPTGSEALAQGGTGDVLAGIIGSITAQWVTAAPVDTVPARVVAAAVWLHGFAADLISARIAPHPANAAALIDELPAALHEVCR